MYLNVLEYELSCTGIYWKFKIVQYWKNENVLENVLECTGISFSILSGHPVVLCRFFYPCHAWLEANAFLTKERGRVTV